MPYANPLGRSRNQKPGLHHVGANGVAELIRSAEKFIASGKFDLALDQVVAAQRIQPHNSYLQAIVYRIQSLRTNAETNILGTTPLPDRYLSLTVGKEFVDGIRDDAIATTDPGAELQNEVRRLTTAAQSLLEKGASQQAFDSLMSAYLLDPMSPYVIASERTIVPAWEKARAKVTAPEYPRSGNTIPPNKNPERITMSNPTSDSPGGGIPLPDRQESRSPDAESTDRLHTLKKKLEQERFQHGQELWKKTSQPSRTPGEKLSKRGSLPPLQPPPTQESNFFAKIRKGKFLSDG